MYKRIEENYTLFLEQKAPEKFLHSSLLARKFDCACTVNTHSNVICKCCPEISLPFILKYLSEKVMGKQDLAGSPCSHANRLYSPVVPWRKFGNIILPARQQSTVLLIVSRFFFFSFSSCFVLFFLSLDLQFLVLLVAGEKQQWESHLINIAGPIVCHQIVLCSCAIAYGPLHSWYIFLNE